MEKIVFDLEIYQKENEGFQWRADMHKENINKNNDIAVCTYTLYVLEVMIRRITDMIDESGVDLLKNPKGLE